MKSAPRLILASASPARRAVLSAAGVEPEIRPARIDEAAVKSAARQNGETAAETALRLATRKAAAIDAPGALVLGCDQLLVCDGAWFDKPETLAAARAQLQTLRGRRHELITAATCHRDGTEIWRHVATPRLTMRHFSDAFLDTYLAAEGEALLGCVGAYRLEGRGIQLFDAVEGEHAAILGVPLLALLGFLREHGVLMP